METETEKAYREKRESFTLEYYLNKDKEKKDKQRAYYIGRKYNLSEQEHKDILLQQNNSCAICGKDQSLFKRKFAIDHNHETGKVRGLLCTGCNCGIGYLKESKDILQKAIEYLSI